MTTKANPALAGVVKVPVSVRAVIQRINRALPEHQKLKTARGNRMRQQAGDYYVIDYSMNAVLNTNVDPETMARELECLKGYEYVVAE